MTMTGLLYINAQHRLVGISPQVSDILGLENAQVQAWIGQCLASPQSFQLAGAPVALQTFLQQLPQGTPSLQVTQLPTSTGRLEVQSTPLYTEAGEWSGTVISLRRVPEPQSAEACEQLLALQKRRIARLETAAQVSRVASSTLDLEALIYQTVNLIRERFELYYVGLFEVDPTGEWAVLHAGTGEAGREMLAQGYRLRIGGVSMIGWCLAQRQPRVALDVQKDHIHLVNPILPLTRSELALPLISRDTVIGALTIQSTQIAAFDDADIAILQTMADQLANAIANARLYTQAQAEIAKRRRIEAQLSTSKSQLEHLLTISPVAIYTAAPSTPTQLNFISDNVVTLLGYSAATLREQPSLAAYIHPDDHHIFDTSHKILLQQGHHTAEYRLRHADGSYRWLNDRRRLVYDAQQHPVEIVGCWIDITERKIADEAMQRLNRELLLLNRASRALAATLNLDEVLSTVLREMQRILNVSACSVWLTDAESGNLVCRHASGPYSEPVLGLEMQPGYGLVGWVLESGQATVVDDLQQDPRHSKEVSHLTALFPRSAMCVPLRSQKGVIGVLQVLDELPARFNSRDLELLEPLAAMAAIAIENARLYEQARLDMHTKSILLDEINHRVKNNLTSIMGILTLEMQHTFNTPQDYQEALRDIQNRIQSITTTHSLLADAQWRPLSLVRLVTEIIHVALSPSPIRQQIRVQVHAEDIAPNFGEVLISPQQATALAIIINELTTNSIKHAFAKRHQGRITVHIRGQWQNDKRHITLSYRDDGPGWPQEVLHGEYANIGLRLIRMTAASPLRGNLQLYNDEGAVTVLTFNLLPSESHFELS